MRLCNVCGELNCACAKPSTQSPQAYWLTAHCATQDCNTTIRWPYNKPMGEKTCKWCQERAGEAHG